MDSLFGVSMNTIMFVLLGLLALSVAVSLIIFVRDRIIFMIGLRNIPRRMAQTVLIIVGLMLSTVIITAAFTTGDTVDYSITKQTYDQLGHTDVLLDSQTAGVGPIGGEPAVAVNADEGGHSISAEQYDAFVTAADKAQLPDVDGYTGMITASVPAIDTSTNLSAPDVNFNGVDEARAGAFPDIIDDDTGEALDVGALGANEVYLNADAADEIEAKAGHNIDTYVNGEKHTLTIKAIVRTSVLAGADNSGNDSPNNKGMVASLATVQSLIGIDRLDNILISATGGVRVNLDTVTKAKDEVQGLMIQNNIQLEVSDTKADLVHDAETIGNVFTTFFLLLGLFSIGAGMLLIVMTFVMLAAERKTEMGMARAIGAKRRHLIEMFIAEGTGYDLVSAFVGVLLGVAVAFALATAASALFSAFGLKFAPHATLRTLVISYSLGVVLTFLTVLFSSWRISNLNIVRAIRDTPDPPGKRMGWRGLAFWILAVVFGALNIWLGLSAGQAFPFAFGMSVCGMGIAVLATHFGAPARPAFTTMGIALLVFWGLTAGDRLSSIFGHLNGGPEMFFLSGVAMVTACTFVIIYNSDIFLGALSRFGGMFGSILPALRTAVAYPMANRFRTGMTLAMISLVVFALTMMSAMNLNYDKLFSADESRGGWDVQVVENPNNPIPSIQQVLQEKQSPVADNIEREGTVEIAGDNSATEVNTDGIGWSDYPVRGYSDGFVEAASVPLDKIANGYDTQKDVWLALKSEPDAAVTDGFTIQSGGFGGDQIQIEGTFGPPVASIHFLTLKDPSNADEVAKEIESTLVVNGVQADSLKQIAEENNALSRNFLYLMQAFMGLGLVVGIAAIGVIAFRTVVERRQQIGMLRAIGYKRRTVALSFMMESSFVTVLGVLSGMGLGLWLAYFLVTSSDFPAQNATFHVPWLQLAFFAVLTIVASLAMTWIPARQAASVPTAEALRYE